MTWQGLVVDDDPAIVDELVETLTSLGHRCETAACMESARLRLAADTFEIPVGGQSKFPRFENGKNLLREIKRDPRLTQMRVIVITGHWKSEPYAGLDVVQLGADGYVVKPFGLGGKTIDDEIRRVVGEPTGANGRASHSELRPFAGGELVFSDAAVTLNRVGIAGRRGRSLARKILEHLNAPTGPDAKFRWQGSSGAVIAEAIGAGDQSAVASAVKKLRDKITKVMEEAGLSVEAEDVIENRGRGYRFTDNITVAGSADTPDEPATGDHEPASDPDDPASGHPDDPTTRRRAWIMTELKCGRDLRRADVMSQFGISESTAKRDLRALIEGGDVEFVGPTKTGHYELTKSGARNR
jgi:DNA-binding response OmpR family regulator